MIVQCPKCGKKVVVKGLGRKPLNIPLKNICDALQANRSVKGTAEELGCSEGYIYNALKAQGLKLKYIVRKNRGKGAAK